MGASDPRTVLTIKSGNKRAVHITDFLSTKAKKKIRQRRHDVVLSRSTDDDDRLIVRTDDQHPYAGISVDEWGAANARVMNRLLQTGDLPRADIEYYLAYTATVLDFVSCYEWSSVLDFDYLYREQQTAHGFQWGHMNPSMELQILVPRLPQHRHPYTKKVHSVNGTEECRQWRANNGFCRFGNTCRYRHSPLTNQTTAQQTKNYQGLGHTDPRLR